MTTPRSHVIAALACVALIVIVTVLTTLAIHEHAQPDCPMEDSCTIDYRDGAWHIAEDH